MTNEKDQVIYELLQIRNRAYDLGNRMDRIGDATSKAHGLALLEFAIAIAGWVDEMGQV